MDPVTAAFNFFSTPAGQKILLRLIELNDNIINHFFAMAKHVAVNAEPNMAAQVEIKK